ncbi:MAG: hypothetical protein GY853_08550 [PVC group bacterium]|nr:hypothetical protein [PVC group bacterium]
MNSNEIVQRQIVNLLWTGGWDSTFRLLDLLLVKEKVVQPYYIIDSDRCSTGLELRAMKDIKQRLFSKHPQIKDLLRPTRYKEMNDILPNLKITQSFELIRDRKGIGSQYDWLARFANEEGLEDLEMSVADKDGRVFSVLKPGMLCSGAGEDACFEIDRKYKDVDVFEVFKNFRFPIFNLTKVDMDTISRKEGFREFMQLTWFCHRPRANGSACGICNPCICAVQEGMGWRLSLLSRVRYYLWMPLRKMRQVLQKYPGLYEVIRKLKRGNGSRRGVNR